MADEERPELLAYKNALARAWLDGVITYDEARMLDSLRENLMISDEEHWALETEIKSKGPDPGIQEYKTALEQAWMDGLLTDIEQDMLKKLREKYEITPEIHATLEMRVKSDLGIDSGGLDAAPLPSDYISIVEPGKVLEDVDDPDTEVYWINEGKKTWYANAQSEEDRINALNCFDKALAINPESYIAWTYKGSINKKMGYSDEALKCYDRAIGLRNDFIASWYNKGVLLAQGSITRLEEAIRCFDEVLRLNPNNQLALRDREILMNLVTLSVDKSKD
jgi:tetratricopeptide (TPR) repeat protein